MLERSEIEREGEASTNSRTKIAISSSMLITSRHLVRARPFSSLSPSFQDEGRMIFATLLELLPIKIPQVVT